MSFSFFPQISTFKISALLFHTEGTSYRPQEENKNTESKWGDGGGKKKKHFSLHLENIKFINMRRLEWLFQMSNSFFFFSEKLCLTFSYRDNLLSDTLNVLTPNNMVILENKTLSSRLIRRKLTMLTNMLTL